MPVRQKTMKKIIMLSALVLGVFVLAGCGQQQTSQTQPTTPTPVVQTPTQKNNETASWQTYTDQTGEFVLKYPSDWTSGICGQDCVMFGPVNKQDYTPVSVVIRLASLDIAKKERLESANKFLSEERINIGNYQWTKLSFQYSATSDELHEYLIEHGGKTYIFKDISDAESISVPILSSFEFTK